MTPTPPHILITAGPTHEPIDAVRFLGNRSSGALGLALARTAAQRGWRVTLLLGPVPHTPPEAPTRTLRFRTTADLQTLLATHAPSCDVLVMAAAVADYRPADPARPDAKLRRTPDALTLRLEPTPDLLAEASAIRSDNQLFVGFALEPRDRLIESATDKLTRKGLDLIVANPLETMDAADIEATILSRPTPSGPIDRLELAPMPKIDFAARLLDLIDERRAQRPRD